MMKKSRHLLLRTAILPGESLPSYLVRLAKRNGYHTLNMVIQLCEEGLSQPDNITRPIHAETYARLADLVKLDDDQLYAASVHNFAFTMLPAGIEPDFITLRSGRAAVILPAAVLREHIWPETDVPFCPHCLAEARYHRLAWLPQAVSVCLEHHCLLIKGCPICGSKLGMGDIVEGRCHQCGFALETSPTISIADDAFGLYSQQVIQSWLGGSPSIESSRYPLLDEPGYLLYQIVYGLQRAIRTIQRQWDYVHDPFDVDTATALFPCEKKTQITPFKSYVLYATALKALLNWSHGLFEFLNAFKLRDQVEPTETITKDLGCIYTNWLKKSWQPPEFSFLQAAFEQYLQENFAFALALQQQYRTSAGHPSAIEPDYITYPDAAQRLSTSIVVIERLVEIGLLAGYSQSQRKSDAQWYKLVSRDSVSALKQRWFYGINLYDAAKVLSISKAITLKMAKAGLIKAVSGPGMDGAQFWKIGSQSLAYFFKRLERSGVRYLYDQPVKMISLTEATKSTAKDGLDTVFLIEQILAGNLRGYWSPGHRNLGQLRVSVADLGTLRRANCGDQVWPMGEKIDIEVATISDGIDCKISEVRLTALQFAQQLGISQEYVWHWTRRGVVMLAPDAELVEN